MIRLIVGPPCAGKSTFISENAKHGDVVLDWDALAEALDAHTTGTHFARDGAVRAVATYARIVLGKYVRETWLARRDDGSEATAWVPVTNPAVVGGLEPYITAGARVTMLDPGISACLERCERDDRPDGTEKAIRDWYEQPPTIPATWLDSLETDEKGGATMRAKYINIKVKATAEEAEPFNPFGGEMQPGDFIAYASTFHDDPDSYGDVMMSGAFTRTLAEWTAKNQPIPLLYGHNMADPAFNIGHIVDAKEDGIGLLVWGRIDMANEKGAQSYRLIKSRRLAQLSFAFDVVEGELNDYGGMNISDVNLHEVSLVQLGANRHTSVLAVKSAADVVQTVKGEFTSDEVDTLRDSAANLREALAEIETLIATTDTDSVANPSEEQVKAANIDKAADTHVSASSADVAAARLRLAATLAATS